MPSVVAAIHAHSVDHILGLKTLVYRAKPCWGVKRWAGDNA